MDDKKFIEKSPYGQVADSDVAEAMATAEGPYHKKRLGVFKASKEDIQKGESVAELTGIVYGLKKSLEQAKEKLDFYRFKESLEKFKKEFPDFESFFQDKDFAFLISGNVKPIIISQKDPKYQELLEKMPFRKDSATDESYCDSKGIGIKILYSQPDGKIANKDVKHRYYAYEDNYGLLPYVSPEELFESLKNSKDKFRKEGETLKQSIQNSNIGENNFVIIIDNDYSYWHDKLFENANPTDPLQDEIVPKKGTLVYLVRKE